MIADSTFMRLPNELITTCCILTCYCCFIHSCSTFMLPFLIEYSILDNILKQSLTLPTSSSSPLPSSSYLTTHNTLITTQLFTIPSLRKRLQYESDVGHSISFYFSVLTLAITYLNVNEPFLTEEHIM